MCIRDRAYTKKMWTQLSDLLRDSAEQEKLGRLQRLIDERAGHWLAMKVEEGKIALSDDVKVRLELDRLAPAVSLELDRAQFDASIDHLVGSVENTVLSLLRDAGVGPADVDTVFSTEPTRWSIEASNCARSSSRLTAGASRSSSSRTLTSSDNCLLYTSPSPRDRQKSRMPSSA